MNVCKEIIVPPMSARAFTVSAGQTVRIVDLEGRQPGDLVAFKADNLAVKLSQARTRVESHKVAVTQGDSLWTNTFPLAGQDGLHRGGRNLLRPIPRRVVISPPR